MSLQSLKSTIRNFTFLFFLFASTSLFSTSFKDVVSGKDKEYTLRLTNGDVISGYIVEFVSDPQAGDGIKLRTALGTATIFEYQVNDIRLKEDAYRQSHRVYLLPTAEPIKDNYFIGDFELLFFYLGGGIGNWFSFTAGRTIIPGISASEQISTVDAKITVFSQDLDTLERKLILAVGANYGWANSPNKLYHLYGAGTFKLSRTSLTANVFYKLGADDINILNFGYNTVEMDYANYSWGLGLGLDSQLPTWHSVHVIGELWNNDISRPSRSGILLGLRVCNTALSADFGIAFFTQPYFVPFFGFVWTPF